MLVGVYGERAVVMGSLSKVKGEEVKLAYTQKARFALIEEYRVQCCHGSADFWYTFLNLAYSKGMWVCWGFIALALLSFVL